MRCKKREHMIARGWGVGWVRGNLNFCIYSTVSYDGGPPPPPISLTQAQSLTKDFQGRPPFVKTILRELHSSYLKVNEHFTKKLPSFQTSLYFQSVFCEEFCNEPNLAKQQQKSALLSVNWLKVKSKHSPNNC